MRFYSHFGGTPQGQWRRTKAEVGGKAQLEAASRGVVKAPHNGRPAQGAGTAAERLTAKTKHGQHDRGKAKPPRTPALAARMLPRRPWELLPRLRRLPHAVAYFPGTYGWGRP